jgi:hypothetical protein
MNSIDTQELNNTTANVSVDLLSTIDEMAEDCLTEIDWAQNPNGITFYKINSTNSDHLESLFGVQ